MNIEVKNMNTGVIIGGLKETLEKLESGEMEYAYGGVVIDVQPICESPRHILITSDLVLRYKETP